MYTDELPEGSSYTNVCWKKVNTKHIFFFFKTEENPTVYERILQETKNRSTFLNTETNSFENIFVMKKSKSLETNIIILKVQVVVPFYKLVNVHTCPHTHKPRVRYIING